MEVEGNGKWKYDVVNDIPQVRPGHHGHSLEVLLLAHRPIDLLLLKPGK